MKMDVDMKSTQFKPVNTQIRFPEVEREVLDLWEREKTFQASLDATAGKQAFVFYDGPPFATGLPHYGHLLAGTLKDIIPRYQTMRGRHVDRRFGWDCHGLPVENEVEKEFKVGGKRGIEKLGIHLFNEACRSIVLRYTSQWETVVNRMGRWVDFENQYRTMDPPYMESIWWVFKQIWDKGLIYNGFRVQPYCPRCTTPLSNFEVNEGYKEVSGPSITVSFPLIDDPDGAKILVWTTTPWTLPSNVALAAGGKIDYVKIRDGDNVYIMAKERLGAYYKDVSTIEIISEMKGNDLAGLRYVPMFDFFNGKDGRFFTVTTGDFVSTADGTGIVHIAPAFGEDDFQIGQKLGLPIVCPVDDEGKFTDEVPQWQGKLVYTADDEIIREIKAMGRMMHKTAIVHRYPHCYRCDTALIYKAITTWFMKVEPLKPNMLDNNKEIRWVPPHLQTGRFGKGIESAPDWNISRNRYWGTPIPVWLCDCGHTECVGGLDDLHKLVGGGDLQTGKALHAQTSQKVLERLKSEDTAQRLADAGIDSSWAGKLKNAEISPSDIHRHIVDELEAKCPKCGAHIKRTTEVLDCWFESGSMPYAQEHYPFDNREKFDANFPADFIAEGLDQTRGWFYTLTVLASALFSKPAFKNVIVNGIILAEDGKKLSKRLRNYAPPEDVLNQLGADALRLFLINSPAVKAEDLRFSEKGVMEMSRAVLLPFWNAYAFFVTYASVDGWKPATLEPPEGGTELDRWIISLLNDVIASVNREMEQYNLYKVVPHLVDFIDNLTNWYIRRSRRRFWKSENDCDKDLAYGTLYYVLVQFSKVMAPFLPFVTEEIYRNLVVGKLAGAPSSVHLADYPETIAEKIDKALGVKMQLVRQAVSMGRALRSRFTIKTRQPLSEFTVVVADRKKIELIMDMEELIKDELNVKKVTFDSQEERVVSISAKPNFKKLGKVFGQRMKDASEAIEKFSAADIKNLESGAAIDVLGTSLSYDDIEIRRTKREGFEVETEDELTVGLEVTITPELKKECMAREFVNRVQNRRKDTGLNVTDRIIIHYSCPPEIKAALADFRGYVCAETLAVDIQYADNVEDIKNGERVEVEGLDVLIGVEKHLG
ncbi:MAG: isoleucine--tRNA ligase [Chitinispirillales bacterium]|jgi:isoleucyl-tRNA synthetase|nr:isoleucine--tRNA ligase [Chitinispirillales bacterium]